jgi:hypothetical protein
LKPDFLEHALRAAAARRGARPPAIIPGFFKRRLYIDNLNDIYVYLIKRMAV